MRSSSHRDVEDNESSGYTEISVWHAQNQHFVGFRYQEAHDVPLEGAGVGSDVHGDAER